MTGRRSARSRTPRATPPVPQTEADASAHNTRASARRPANANSNANPNRPELAIQGSSAYGSPSNIALNQRLSAANVQRGFAPNFDQRARGQTEPAAPSSPLAAREPLAHASKKPPNPRRRAAQRSEEASARVTADQPAVAADTNAAAEADEPHDPDPSPPSPILAPSTEAAAAAAAEQQSDSDYYHQMSRAIDAALFQQAQEDAEEDFPLSFNPVLDSPAPSHPSRGYVIAIFCLAFSILFYAVTNTPFVNDAVSYLRPAVGEAAPKQDKSIVKAPSLTSALIPRPKEVSINFFSPGAGATVDPRLSSPSMYHFKDVGDRLKYPLLHDITTVQQPNQALQPYHDIGDAWCTTTKHLTLPEDGDSILPVKAQLAVSLAHAVYPRLAFIESPPAHILLDPTARPGAMSLWVQISEPMLRNRVRAATQGVTQAHSAPPTPEKPTIGRADAQNSGWLGFLASSAPPASDLALDESWVLVARREHDDVVAADGQVFVPLDVDMEALGAPIYRAVFRVETNLGQDYTCLYRVSLSGKLASPHV